MGTPGLTLDPLEGFYLTVALGKALECLRNLQEEVESMARGREFWAGRIFSVSWKMSE